MPKQKSLRTCKRLTCEEIFEARRTPSRNSEKEYCSRNCYYLTKRDEPSKTMTGSDYRFVCSSCSIEKDKSEFSKDSSTKTGYCYRCKLCANSYHKQWADQNDHNLRNTASLYNLGYENLKNMIEFRSGICDACGEFTEQFHVDHDHECCVGKGSCGQCVRGLLCGSCNLALGLVKDNIKRLNNLINYLNTVKNNV